MYSSWRIRAPLGSRLVGLLAIFALVCAGLSSACGGGYSGDTNSTQGGSEAIPGTSFEITARNLRFNLKKMTAPANTAVTITLLNQDAGVPHNISIYTSKQARERILIGEIFTGVATRQYELITPAVGDYFFRCDTHVDTMNGTFAVR